MSDNTAGGSGGGLYVYQGGSGPVLDNVSISGSGSAFRGNTAAYDGGGIFVYQGGTAALKNVRVDGTLVEGNKATNGNGGGIYVYQSGASLLANVLVGGTGSAVRGNTAGANGGGMWRVRQVADQVCVLASGRAVFYGQAEAAPLTAPTAPRSSTSPRPTSR